MTQLNPSGAQWANRFQTSRSTQTLSGTFRAKAESFIAALRAAGATVSIAATYRPPERAHLMHYSFRIAKEGLAPGNIPVYPGVNIQWLHTDSLGNPDIAASRAAASEMVKKFEIVHRPSLKSRHTQGLAIDMSISWNGALNIALPTGKTQTIATAPHSGNNAALHAVGRAYGVIKLVTDRPHWSSDGH